jgi:hypothetical protein
MGICGSLWHTYQRQVMSEDIGQQKSYPLATTSKGCWLSLAGWDYKYIAQSQCTVKEMTLLVASSK